VLERQGPNTRHPDCLRFSDNAAPQAMEALTRAYLAEAMGYAMAGILPPKDLADIDLPAELVEALDSDTDLAEAFHALTPGRQKSYVILLSDARTVATRVARIAKSRDKILAGKGANER
jgi:uncharacterized protein YdeI (YjbR/CyaY-like superfamily)